MPKGDLFNELTTPKGRPFLERGCKGSAFYCNRKLFLDFFYNFFRAHKRQIMLRTNYRANKQDVTKYKEHMKNNGKSEESISIPATSAAPRLTTHDYALHAPATTP